MGGNARVDNYSKGVLQDLFARAAWIEVGSISFCIISLDLLGLWESDAVKVREAAAKSLGIPVDHLMVACTRTHSGRDTFQSFWWNEEKYERDTRLLGPFWWELPKKAAAAAVAARAGAQEA